MEVKMFNKNKLFVFLVLAALVLSACGTAAPADTSSANVSSNAPTIASQTQDRPTYKFEFPHPVTFSGSGWKIEGISANVPADQVLVAGGEFKNTIGLGTQSWLADDGTLLVGPGFPQEKVDAADGAIEYLDQINQELIDGPEQWFHINEDRFTFCSFGSAVVELAAFEYSEGHNYFLIIRGLFPDGKQDVDRNHSILFHEVVGSHAQCMSYPQNGGGFMSEENFLQVAELSHKDGNDCGAEGCSKLTSVFVDLNTGALTVLTQQQLNAPWNLALSNWFMK